MLQADIYCLVTPQFGVYCSFIIMYMHVQALDWTVHGFPPELANRPLIFSMRHKVCSIGNLLYVEVTLLSGVKAGSIFFTGDKP